MVSEFNHRYQLADSFRVDAQAAKFCLNNRIKQLDERKISGYVQSISQDPFGIVLTSDIQVAFIFKFKEKFKNYKGQNMDSYTRIISSPPL